MKSEFEVSSIFQEDNKKCSSLNCSCENCNCGITCACVDCN